MGADSEGLVADTRLALIRVNDLRDVWDVLEPLIERMCAHSAGEFTPQAVLAGLGLYDGVQRLHMLGLVKGNALIAAMATAVNQYPTREGPWVRKLDCLLVSGADVAEWMPHEPEMDEWARSLGCVAVRIPRARKGWLRVMAHWTKLSGDTVVMERAI